MFEESCDQLIPENNLEETNIIGPVQLNEPKQAVIYLKSLASGKNPIHLISIG